MITESIKNTFISYPKKPLAAIEEKLQTEGTIEYNGNSHRDIIFNELFGGKLILMRHTHYDRVEQTGDNRKLYGYYDGPITSHGKEIIAIGAKNLAEYLPPVVAIVSSTAQRASQTAKVLEEELYKNGVLTLVKIEMDEFCERKLHGAHRPKEIYPLLLSTQLFGDTITYPIIVVTHQPNIETYSSIVGTKRYQDFNYLDCIMENGIVFKTDKDEFIQP